jgi:tetratricopeptide (TPR) repeat protein
LGDATKAEASYQVAITHDAPQRLEAYQRRASLLRRQLNKPGEADRLIEEMVKSDPGNSRVYLERARYLRGFAKTDEEKKAVIADLKRVLKQSPKEPEVYLELAAVGKPQDARQVLEDGLKEVPGAPSLHKALAMVSGSVDTAIASLRHSLQFLPDDVELHWLLANFLAEKGDTVDLQAQIEELQRLKYSPILVEFLEAYQQVNSKDWQSARQTLVKLQAPLDRDPNWKARLNNLLARCYGQLGDRERERDAYRRALDAKPEDIPARLGLAGTMVSRGEIEEAIEAYRKVADQVPQAWSPLAHLLIARNQQLSPSQRNWTEITKLAKRVNDFAPNSSEWVLLQVDVLLAEGNIADARKLLAEARSKSPQNVELYVKLAEVLRRQHRYAEAGSLLDQAQKVGDTVGLRLERAQLLVAQGAAELSKSLGGLAANSREFSPDDRLRLLKTLAAEFIRLNDVPQAEKLLLDVVGLDRNNLEPRLSLLELAFQANNNDLIKTRLKELKEVDGSDGPTARYQEIRYTLWRAESATDTEEQKALRSNARLLISDLQSRRPDWPQIPLALAQLDEQELTQPNLDSATRKRKEDDAANHYLRAISLGQRSLPIIRRVTDLLYKSGRSSEVTKLWNQLPSVTLSEGNLQHQVIAQAINHQDFECAIDLARKAKVANPDDFQSRLLLVEVLLKSQRPKCQDDAEAELRDALNAARFDPDRWIALVGFLAQTKKMDMAEQAVRDAVVPLQDNSPISLARCSEVMGQTYKQASQEAKAKFWYDAATQWYKADLKANPEDPAAIRRLVEFLLRSGQFKEVENQLEGISKDPKLADEAAWARRTLALTLLSGNDYRQNRKALEILQPVEQAHGGRGANGKTAPTPDDLRALARVYLSMVSTAYKQKARKILEELADSHEIVPDDRLVLAQMYDNDGELTKAHEQYHALFAQTENSRDVEVILRRPVYLARFILDLLRHFESGHDQKYLSEAQELIERLKSLSSSTLIAVEPEARSFKAQGQIEEAEKLIQTTADRPNLMDGPQQALAKLAEDLGRIELAERLFRRLTKRSESVQNRLALATFLGRHGKQKEAIEDCERLWKVTANPEVLVPSTLDVLFSPGSPKPDPPQLERVAGWILRGLEQKPMSSILNIALANVRERQGRFQDAFALYRQNIEQGQGDVVALNNLAWLLAMRNEKLNEALDLINRAIDRRGPLAELLDTRGVVYTKLGDTRHAIEDLDQATTDAPTGPKYFHLAQAHLRAGDKPAAAESLAKAQAKGLKPDDLHPLEATVYHQVLTELAAR